jgi:alkylhydroperoxidase/carboxymuconolactone decarboxylase family protein YurZ
MVGDAREVIMAERRRAAISKAHTSTAASKSGTASGSPYGYAWTEWLAAEDPEFAAARKPLSALSTGEGKELSVKYREMVIIGILAFRGRLEGVIAHMRRAIQHGATKRELLEAVQSAGIPGGGPTLSTGVQAIMALDKAGAFKTR